MTYLVFFFIGLAVIWIAAFIYEDNAKQHAAEVKEEKYNKALNKVVVNLVPKIHR